MTNYKLEDVFGTARKLPSSYIERAIDQKFLDSLEGEKHIVIYGSSKQGKTCLRKKYLKEDEYITIVCSDKQRLSDLHEKILREAGVEIVIKKSKTQKGELNAGLESGINLGLTARAKGSLQAGFQNTRESEPFNIDIEDVNDIIRELQKVNFKKIILLEDFHYLSLETQRDFANALKAYHENSNLKFIVVGVWLDHNKLITFNGDLAGRIISINVDSWNFNYLRSLIEEGCRLLNIKFDEGLIDDIIDYSYDNVYFVQEMCYRICNQYKIRETLPDDAKSSNKSGYYDSNEDFIEEEDILDNRFLIKIDDDFGRIVKEIVEQHSGRYNAFLHQFSNNNEASKWIIYCLFKSNTSQLQDGLSIMNILDVINNNLKGRNKAVAEREIIEVLESVTQFQYKSSFKPAIVDYDHGIKRLSIVDKEFIIWLSFQSQETRLFYLNGSDFEL